MRDYPIRPDSKLWASLKPLAREMRHEPTPAEECLWQQLRNRQIKSCKFRRQHAVDRFIADFYCSEANLIIEVDGPIHQRQIEEDRERDEILASMGFRVLRFTNERIRNDLTFVLEEIARALR